MWVHDTVMCSLSVYNFGVNSVVQVFIVTDHTHL